MGDASSAVASAGIAKALSSDPAFAKQVMLLQAQLSRFGSRAPVGLQLVPSISINGVLDANTAARAVQVLQRRAQDAIWSFPGESDDALKKLADATTSLAMTDPVSWVLSPPASLGMGPSLQQPWLGVQLVASLIQRYADSKALPPAPDVTFSSLAALTDSPAGLAVLAAVGLGGAYLIFGKRKRARRR